MSKLPAPKTKLKINTASVENITIDDVRAALGDTDPNVATVSPLRAVIGRGSYDTVKKYLEMIRAEKSGVVATAVAPAKKVKAKAEVAEVVMEPKESPTPEPVEVATQGVKVKGKKGMSAFRTIIKEMDLETTKMEINKLKIAKLSSAIATSQAQIKALLKRVDELVP